MIQTATYLPIELENLVVAQAATALPITNQVDQWLAYEDAKVAIRQACENDEAQYLRAIQAYCRLTIL